MAYRPSLQAQFDAVLSQLLGAVLVEVVPPKGGGA